MENDIFFSLPEEILALRDGELVEPEGWAIELDLSCVHVSSYHYLRPDPPHRIGVLLWIDF